MTIRLIEKLSVQPGTNADEVVVKSQLDTAEANAKARSSHTGSQSSTTISDFQTAVQNIITTFLELSATPATLDTLNELAAALGDDPNFAATLAGQIAGLDGRLDTLETAPDATRSGAILVGNGTDSTFTVTHNWALTDKNLVRVEIVEEATGETVLAKVTRTTINAVAISFGSAVPTVGQYKVLLAEVVV